MKLSTFIFAFFLGLNILTAQEHQFKVLDSETKNPVSEVNVYKNGVLNAVSDSSGIFNLEVETIPGKFQLKAIGGTTLDIYLENKNFLQIIYYPQKEATIPEIVLYSTVIHNTLQKSPSAISIIKNEDFNRTDATNILESFKNVAGLNVDQGALNTNKINIRGIGSRSQYSTNRIQAYFDGIPLTNGEGELTLDDFDQETLDRVEIIKGPTSSIYGAGLGGSINLFSKKDRNLGTSLKLKSQAGSSNTFKNLVQISNSTKKSSFSATYSNLVSDGYRDNGNYRRNSALITGNINTGQKSRLSYLANFTRLKANIPSSLNKTDFTNNPEKADAAWENSKGYESYDRGLLGASYVQPLSDKLMNTTSIFINFRDGYEPRPFDILEEKQVASGIRTKFNLDSKLFQLPSKISFGGEFYSEWYETGNFKNLYKNFPGAGSVEGERFSKNEQDRRYSNFFGQINLNLTEKWILESGFNINSTRYSLTDLFNKNENNSSGDYQFKTIISPRIASSYEIEEGKNIYISLSSGFSTPSVAETLTPEGQINTSLKPEKGVNYELGFKGNWLKNKLYTEASIYSIQIDDLLVAQRVAEDQYVGINAGKTRHNGVEFASNYQLDFRYFFVKPYISTAFNFFKFIEFIDRDKDFAGNDLPGVPQYAVNTGVDFKFGKNLEIFTNYRMVGKMPLNDANSDYSGAYQIFNLKINYQIPILEKVNMNLYGGINNILDERYASSILTNAMGFGGKLPRYYYPGNPRNYFGGLQINYLF